MSDCLFCKMVSGEIQPDVVFEDDEVLAFMDIAPQAPKHFLVIPKKHISGPSDIREEDDKLIGKLMRVGAAVATENGIGDGFRVIFNNGAKAGQVVFHIHMHVLGGKDKPWPL